MTLKEELEILRGEPIRIFDGNPMDIPCIETSDPAKLCKNPVVSVHMITYNHEPYIRQAIEGVMMQKTDFEFELIVGEDASQDKTRDICFEHQKRYPDKIRVLWWHENVSKLGGNSRRVLARCRGEFIAYCEGDDCWIDPLKLQKQVDCIRETGSVMCVANSEWHYPDGSVKKDIYRRDQCELVLSDLLAHYFHTTTYLVNRRVYECCKQLYPEIIFWYDVVIATCMATMGKVCFLPDIVSIYNWTGVGAGGAEGSSRRDILQLLQYVQFSMCHNNEISEYYYTKIFLRAKNSLDAFSDSGFRHPIQIRMRIVRVMWGLCVTKGRASQGIAFVLSVCYGWMIAWLKLNYVRHPKVGVCYRSIKSVFK